MIRYSWNANFYSSPAPESEHAPDPRMEMSARVRRESYSLTDSQLARIVAILDEGK